MKTNNMFKKIKSMVFAAAIAAIYAGLTVIAAPISYGPVQFRISEAMNVLAVVFPEAIWGLSVGCFLSNMIGGYGLPDMVFGTLATVLSCLWISKLKHKLIIPLPPVIVNGVVVGLIIAWAMGGESFWYTFIISALQVAGGEMAVMYILGLPLLYALPRLKNAYDRISY